jgi:hypothetical protein
MIQLIRILLACQPIDFRNGIDGLAALCKRALAEDPFSGALFLYNGLPEQAGFAPAWRKLPIPQAARACCSESFHVK